MRAERIPPTRRAAATIADPRTRCSAGPPGGLTSLPGAPGPARPRRADDGSVSRAPATQARSPPARSAEQGAATAHRARSPGVRGALTYPKPAKEPPGEDRFVFLRTGPLPGAVSPPLTGSPHYWGAGGAVSPSRSPQDWGPGGPSSPGAAGVSSSLAPRRLTATPP